MQTIIRLTLVILAVTAIQTAAFAEIISLNTKARVKYSKMSSEVEEQAVEVAKLNALKKATKKLSKAQKRMLKDLEDDFYSNADDFIVEVIVLKDKDNPSKKQYTLAAKIAIDTEAISNFFIENSEAGNLASGEGSAFGLLTVARKETSRKSYKEKKTDVNASSSSLILREESASDGSSSVDSVSTESISSTSSGGSTELKADKVVYEPDVTLSSKADVALSAQFTDAGFEFKDVERIAARNDVPLIEDLIKSAELADDGTLPKRALFQYQDLAIDELWTFLGYAVLDVGSPRKDATSGSTSVVVSLNMRVWFVEGDDPTVVAAVEDKVFEGLGSGADEAEKLAINAAAKAASQIVVGQLQAKQLF